MPVIAFQYMKKNIILAIVIFLLAISVSLIAYFLARDDSRDGFGMAENGIGTQVEDDRAGGGEIPTDAVMVVVRSPKANETVSSPLEIEGEARGNWYFEADFPVKLLDESGKILAQGIATALSDWMTTDFVPFELTLDFDPGSSGKGLLVFEKDNPSGLAENADSYEVPVFFENGTETTVKVFFGNPVFDPGAADCGKVYAVERKVEKTPRIGQSALGALLEGPTEEEKAQGYFSSIEPGTELRGLSIQHGVAFVDFSEALDANVAGSCRVTAIRAQIEQTLRQFPTVNEVQIYIGERSEDVLQP